MKFFIIILLLLNPLNLIACQDCERVREMLGKNIIELQKYLEYYEKKDLSTNINQYSFLRGKLESYWCFYTFLSQFCPYKHKGNL